MAVCFPALFQLATGDDEQFVIATLLADNVRPGELVSREEAEGAFRQHIGATEDGPIPHAQQQRIARMHRRLATLRRQRDQGQLRGHVAEAVARFAADGGGAAVVAAAAAGFGGAVGAQRAPVVAKDQLALIERLISMQPVEVDQLEPHMICCALLDGVWELAQVVHANGSPVRSFACIVLGMGFASDQRYI